MAAIITHARVRVLYNEFRVHAEFAPGTDRVTYTELTPPISNDRYLVPNVKPAVIGPLTAHETSPAENVTGLKQPSFLEDFYYRIHVNPGVLTLGNILSTQTRLVEVWNSYLSRQQLLSVTASGVDGVTMTAPENPPTYFEGLESRTYALEISTNGSPVISGGYVFNFANDTPTLKLTGRRVVVWPWMPQTEHKESNAWLTDIIQSYGNEQRLALRVHPRQEFTYTFDMDENQYSRAKAVATQWAHRVYGIPVWSELTRVGAIAMGATSVQLDTAFADYRENDIILVWESDSKFLALETGEISSSNISLKLPTDVSFSNAYIAPLRFARTKEGVTFSRGRGGVTTATGKFTVTQGKDLAAVNSYPKYRGRDVMTDPLFQLSSISHKISRGIDIFDNGSGPTVIDTQSSYVRNTSSLTIDTLNRSERWRMRQWLHALRGRQKSFWLSSGNEDLIMTEDISATSSTLTVRPIGYPLYYGVKDLVITTRTGEVYARVLTSSTNPNGQELLALAAPVGVEILVVDVVRISFITLYRLDSDNVSASHSFAGRFTTTIPIVEVPE